jgi:phage-related protein
MSERLRDIEWIASSYKDLMKLPADVIEILANALQQARLGEDVNHAKAMKGFKGNLVMEIALRHKSNAYRCVYVVTLPDAIYVLHCFTKKSKSGIATPQQDIDLIRARLKTAIAYSQVNRS